jgi:hypothetical protein
VVSTFEIKTADVPGFRLCNRVRLDVAADAEARIETHAALDLDGVEHRVRQP